MCRQRRPFGPAPIEWERRMSQLQSANRLLTRRCTYWIGVCNRWRSALPERYLLEAKASRVAISTKLNLPLKSLFQIHSAEIKARGCIERGIWGDTGRTAELNFLDGPI